MSLRTQLHRQDRACEGHTGCVMTEAGLEPKAPSRSPASPSYHPQAEWLRQWPSCKPDSEAEATVASGTRTLQVALGKSAVSVAITEMKGSCGQWRPGLRHFKVSCLPPPRNPGAPGSSFMNKHCKLLSKGLGADCLSV